MTTPTLDGAVIETDGRSRVVLPGHPNRRYLAREDADGTLILQPAVVMTELELALLANPAMQETIRRAEENAEGRVPAAAARARRRARKAA